MDKGMEKMAPPPVPTHKRPQITVREEIWRGESVRKGWPVERERERKLVSKAVRLKLKWSVTKQNVCKTKIMNKIYTQYSASLIALYFLQKMGKRGINLLKRKYMEILYIRQKSVQASKSIFDLYGDKLQESF